ncbi:MAG: hypothetical protein PSW75_00200 [bacterium]|nr:hypothetical protein [bacterium]MDI1336545.1 hypothetical protein [Lacunisphaera sp.]
MIPLVHGLVAGLVFGALSAASMLPMKFPDKRAALLGAFLNRFGVGLVIPLAHVALPASPGWALGAGLGLLLSLPDAIITKAYVPILVLGTAGGAVIGWLA